jgi:hypothetical protein
MSEPEVDSEHKTLEGESAALIDGLAKLVGVAKERVLNREEVAEVLRLEARARWLRKHLDPREEASRRLRKTEAEMTRLLKRRQVGRDLR